MSGKNRSSWSTARLLLSHEMTLAIRALALDRLPGKGRLLAAGIVLMIIHVHGLALSFPLPEAGLETNSERVIAGIVVWYVWLTMLQLALSRSMVILYTRNDSDLMLAAPLNAAGLVIARTVSVAAATLMAAALLLFPFANMSIVTGKSWMWSVFLIAPLGALLASALGMAGSLAMVQWLGARRARSVILWALPAFVVAGGLLSLFAVGWLRRIAEAGADDLIATWVVQAAKPTALLLMAEGEALLWLAAATAAAMGFAWIKVSADMLDRANQSGHRHWRLWKRRARPRRLRGQFQVQTCWKEWVLLMRDPLNLSNVALPLVAMVPSILVGGVRDPSLAALEVAITSALITVFAGFVVIQIGVITVNMDEAPSMIYSSPQRVGRLVQAKAWAAMIPASAIAMGLIATVVALRGAAYLYAVPAVFIACFATGALLAKHARIAERAAIGKLERSDIPLFLKSVGLSTAAAAGSALLVLGQEGAGVGTLAVLWLLAQQSWKSGGAVRTAGALWQPGDSKATK